MRPRRRKTGDKKKGGEKRNFLLLSDGRKEGGSVRKLRWKKSPWEVKGGGKKEKKT